MYVICTMLPSNLRNPLPLSPGWTISSGSCFRYDGWQGTIYFACAAEKDIKDNKRLKQQVTKEPIYQADAGAVFGFWTNDIIYFLLWRSWLVPLAAPEIVAA